MRAIIETNPSALKQAAALDAERAVSGKRSLLHGIPVIVKVHGSFLTMQRELISLSQDNIATIAAEGEHSSVSAYKFAN